MQEDVSTSGRTERRGMALAALIMALVALLCAFIVEWRLFALVVAGAALIVALYVLSQVKHPGPSKKRALAAVMVSIVAAAVAGYFLSQIVKPDPEGLPAELHDSTAVAPGEETLDRLRMNMDSSQAQ